MIEIMKNYNHGFHTETDRANHFWFLTKIGGITILEPYVPGFNSRLDDIKLDVNIHSNQHNYYQVISEVYND